jgi:hypothetical protein
VRGESDTKYDEPARKACVECDVLRQDLVRVEKDIAAIRDEIKFNDEISPVQIVSKFDGMLTAISKTCFDIRDDFVGMSELTTRCISHRGSSKTFLPDQLQSLLQSGSQKDWSLEDLLEHRSVYVS